MTTIEKFYLIVHTISSRYNAEVRESGIRKLAEFAEHYGIDEVAIATDICIKKYKVEEFFYKIGGVLYNRSLPTRDIE